MAAPRVHHLNCGTMCPRGRRLVNGDGSFIADGRVVCHVLLIEAPDGLVLVDTGFGTADITNPRELARPFKAMMRPRLDPSETALSQVRAAGFGPADVRHILMTHLDLDHAGGLPDFPQAEVHLFAPEHEAMLSPPLRERIRYSIASVHWAHRPRWVPHEVAGEQWFGFESVRGLPAGDDEILLIPLIGHSLGHTGVAVRRSNGWLLHCGDAYFHHRELRTPPSCPPALRALQTVVEANRKLRHSNQERLRELARRASGEVQLICSHDPVQLEQAQAATAS